MGEALISKRRHIGLKVESTKGTYTAPDTTSCAIHAYDIQASTEFGRFDRDTQKAYLSKLPGIVGTKKATISFKCEVRHTNNTTTLDVWERALQGCGFLLSTSTLKPTSNQDAQVTLSIVVALGSSGASGGSVLFKASGCAGNVSFSGKVGEPLIATFTFTGIYEGVVDGSLEVPTMEVGLPAIFQGVSFSYGGGSRILSTLTFDMGNSVVLRESVNAASGYAHALIADRRPTGTIDPDLELVATDDFYGAMVANTSKAISWAVTTGANGGTARTQTFTLADCRVTNVADSNRNGIQVAGVSFEIVDTLDSTTPDGDVAIVIS